MLTHFRCARISAYDRDADAEIGVEERQESSGRASVAAMRTVQAAAAAAAAAVGAAAGAAAATAAAAAAAMRTEAVAAGLLVCLDDARAAVPPSSLIEPDVVLMAAGTLPTAVAPACVCAVIFAPCGLRGIAAVPNRALLPLTAPRAPTSPAPQAAAKAARVECRAGLPRYAERRHEPRGLHGCVPGAATAACGQAHRCAALSPRSCVAVRQGLERRFSRRVQYARVVWLVLFDDNTPAAGLRDELPSAVVVWANGSAHIAG